jgi:hypothetical protein
VHNKKKQKKLKFRKMKKFTSLLLVMIFTMSIMAQKLDTLNVEKVDTITTVDTAVFKIKDKAPVEERRLRAEERRERAEERRAHSEERRAHSEERRKNEEIIIDTLIVDSSENNMHVKVKGKDVIIIQNEDGTTRVNVSKDENRKKVTLHVDTDVDYDYDYDDSDTTRIRIGKKKFIIIEDGDNDQISFENEDFDDNNKFKGHFSGIDIGINNYFTSDFSTSLPLSDEYMNLNSGKSWGVNINFIQQSIALLNNNIGLVTGMGLEFNNYRFDNK